MAFDKFKRKKFTELTSSADLVIRESYRKIPAVLRLGKKEKTQGGFFDYKGVIRNKFDKSKLSSKYEDNSVIVVQDPTTNETAVLIKPDAFRDSLKDFIENTTGFSADAASQISSSFFKKIGDATSNMPSTERYVSILASPFEQGSLGTGTDVIGPVTASLFVSEAPGIAFDISGNLRKRKITYINSSSNLTNSHFFFNFDEKTSDSNFGDSQQEAATDALIAANQHHLTRSFKAHTNVSSSRQFYYVQPEPVTEFSIEMSSSAIGGIHTASFFALTSSFSGAADFGVLSGSFMGKVIETGSTFVPRHYNGTFAIGAGNSGDETDGVWCFSAQKGIVEGEGEFAIGESNYGGNVGSNVAFTPVSLVVWYPTKYNYSNVRSASFYFTPYPENMNQLNTGATTKALVTGSISSSEAIGTGELRTLFWLNHTFTSSFTGSFGNFTRHELRTQTGGAQNHQLPYMNTSIREFGKKGQFANASHLWKDSALSIPADKGYYVHSASFSQASKNQMSASLGSANHTSSFFVYGSFTHPFVPFFDTAIMNYTASQEGSEAVNADTTLSYHPILSCIFLKRFDDQVFIFQPKDGQAVISESVG